MSREANEPFDLAVLRISSSMSSTEVSSKYMPSRVFCRIFVTFGTKLTEYSAPPKGSAFTLNNGSFIARHDYGCNQ